MPHFGRTALEGAAEHERIDMVQLLLDAGAAIEEDGRPQYDNALKLAARNGHMALRRLLVSYHDSRYGTQGDIFDRSTGPYENK
jgi:ankyrin repeat protein